MPVRLLLALLGGLCIWAAFPAVNTWWTAPIGVALLALATAGTTAGRGFLLGFATGMAYFTPLLAWSGVYLGALPWMALSISQSMYLGALGTICALVQRRDAGPRLRPGVVALAWVSVELARSHTPFGGFPWGRLAFSQADSPLAGLAVLGGAPAVTAGVALTGGLIALAIDRMRTPQPADTPRDRQGIRPELRRLSGRVRMNAVAVAGSAMALTALSALIPRPSDGPTAAIMAIQGNVPQAGLDFNAQRRAVLDNHVRATREAFATSGAGPVDLVVWPENASDIDPLRNDDARSEIESAVAAAQAPILVGAVLTEPGEQLTNASLLFSPGQGITARYDKRHPAPFAEYIPWRPFFRLFTDQVDLVRRDFAAGSTVGVMPVPRAAGGSFLAGVNICFEVAGDDLVLDAVREGANLIVVQTNNATFGFTDESAQQLAISRIRAIEHNRSVVHISTVGVSALISPSGTAAPRTSLFSTAILRADLPLRQDLTLATRLGPWPSWLAALVLSALLGSVWIRRAR